MRRLWIALIPAVAALTACRNEKVPPPIGVHLAAPTGMLVLGSSSTPVLLVTNANFQLDFDTGSVVALDMSRVDESARFNRVEDVAISALPLPNFSGPIALAPDGTTALVTNRFTQGDSSSSPDRLYFVDVSNPAALSLVTLPPGHIGTDGAINVGEDPFGVITVSRPPEGPGRPPREYAFVANETDGTISVVNLTPGSICNDLAPAPCEQDALGPPRASRAVFADVGTASSLNFDGPGISPLITRTQHWAITYIEGNGFCPVPADGSPPGYWRVVGSQSGQLLRHACTGFLYVDTEMSFQINRVTDSAGNLAGTGPTEGDQFDFDTFFGDFEPASRIVLSRPVDQGLVSGRGVGELLYDPLRDRIYATSRLTNLVYVVDATTWDFLGAFQISSNVSGIDARGLALAPDGSELYVIDRSPESVMVIDPDLFDGTATRPRISSDSVIASISTSGGPAQIALSPDGAYAFVTGFNANVVDVIDLRQRRLLRSIPTSHGPYGIRLSSDGRRAYVTTFFGPAVDVLDTDTASPTFGTVLTTIANDDYVPEF